MRASCSDQAGLGVPRSPSPITSTAFDRQVVRLQLLSSAIGKRVLDVAQRTQEIVSISNDVSVLSEIFRDINNMVLVQGVTLDQIDDNINNVIIHVNEGTKEIKKAYEYKRGCKTTICILILLIIVIILSVIVGLEYSGKFKN